VPQLRHGVEDSRSNPTVIGWTRMLSPDSRAHRSAASAASIVCANKAWIVPGRWNAGMAYGFGMAARIAPGGARTVRAGAEIRPIQ
jgi:hypothetical protein